MDKLSNNYEWVIYVDVDEFISTRKNLNHTIKDELETTFKDAHCVKVPWVMMSCKLRETNPKSILNEITYRWNHDIRHPHKVKKFRCRYHSIETKCIFKQTSPESKHVYEVSKIQQKSTIIQYESKSIIY